MMRLFRMFLAFVLCTCFLGVTLLVSCERVIFRLPYYEENYQKNGIAEYTGLPQEALTDTTVELLKYLRGEREDLSIEATAGGHKISVFSADEQEHMVDVRAIVSKGYLLRNILLGVGIGALFLIIFLSRRASGWMKDFIRCYWIEFGIISVLLAVIAIWSMVSFESIFLLFHRMSFSNMLWMMDPADSLMIRMFPESFFLSMAMRIMATTAVFWVGGVVVSLVLWPIARRKKKRA